MYRGGEREPEARREASCIDTRTAVAEGDDEIAYASFEQARKPVTSADDRSSLEHFSRPLGPRVVEKARKLVAAIEADDVRDHPAVARSTPDDDPRTHCRVVAHSRG